MCCSAELALANIFGTHKIVKANCVCVKLVVSRFGRVYCDFVALNTCTIELCSCVSTCVDLCFGLLEIGY